jgi:hypothetical protein
VQRRPGRDGRSISIHLTPAGDQLARLLLDRRDRVLADSLSPLGPQDRQLLTGLVEKLLGHITEDYAHGQRICRFCDVPTCPSESCPVTLAAGPRPWPPSVPLADKPG